MRVLVTGGSGFLGSWIVRELEKKGHEPYSVSRAEGGYNLLTERGRLEAFRDSRPEAVIHAAAAVGGIGANVAEPGRFFYENALMGMELMELARLAGVAKFVTIGTACEYPEGAPLPLREETLWDGYPAQATAPYALAKRALLEMGIAYRQQYGFSSIHLLPTNLYGPGDYFEPGTSHVVPALIRKIWEAKQRNLPSVEIWGTGLASRDFLHVRDAARGAVLALGRYDSPVPLNLATGIETSIRRVAELTAEIVGFEGSFLWDASKPEGVTGRRLDTWKAARIGFRHTTGFEAGLRETIEWYIYDEEQR
jgi:GDP-L-fucose synthase